MEKTLSLPAEIEALGAVYPWLAAACAEAGVPEQVRYAMHVAAEEAAANVAMHAYPAGVTGILTLTLRVTAEAAIMVLEDEGVAFDPTVGTAPRGHAAGPGGRGLRLLRHYCRDATYARQGNGNRLTLRFPLPPRRRAG